MIRLSRTRSRNGTDESMRRVVAHTLTPTCEAGYILLYARGPDLEQPSGPDPRDEFWFHNRSSAAPWQRRCPTTFQRKVTDEYRRLSRLHGRTCIGFPLPRQDRGRRAQWG